MFSLSYCLMNTMNKFTISIIALAICLSSCGQKETKQKNEPKMKDNNSKTLVAYFSATGTTKLVAERIAKATDGDIYAIEPAEEYTDADLNWRDKKSRSTVEMNDPKSRPEMKEATLNIEQYDTVYVGFPVWWYVAPRIINTFVETYDLSGKVLIPFATSGGSGIENCVKDLRNVYPSLNWQDGKLLNGATQETIDKWVK